MKTKSKQSSSMAQEKKEIDADKVMKAARLVSGHKEEDSDEESDGDSDDSQMYEAPKKVQKEEIKSKKQQTGVPTMVEFGDSDLQGFNAEKKKLIKEQAKDSVTEEAQLLKSLFVTQEEDAYDEFEQDKDKQVEN